MTRNLQPQALTHPPHPGPRAAQRFTRAMSRAQPCRCTIAPGEELLPALARQLSPLSENERDGHVSASLTIRNAEIEAMHYVIPAPAPDETHAAWYSEITALHHPAHIEHAVMTLGMRDETPFFHCHGTWQAAGGQRVTGHLMPDHCVFSTATPLAGYTFPDATFVTTPDEETNFALFKPMQDQVQEKADAALLRLAPDVDLDAFLIEQMDHLAWPAARVHGLGSLIGAHFADDSTLQSYATEFYIRDGRVDRHECTLDIGIGGIEAGTMTGRLARGHNRTFVTAELVLIREPGVVAD